MYESKPEIGNFGTIDWLRSPPPALTMQVKPEKTLTGLTEERAVMMQGESSTLCNPCYAAFVDVPIPDERNGAFSPNPGHADELDKLDMFAALAPVPTQYVRMEEKNVYCAPYNVRRVYDRPEAKRAIHYAGKRYMAIGSYDNKIRIIDVIRGHVVRVIAGHAGSVRCVHLKEDRQYVVTGSYDTTVRCWSTIDGSCLKIYRGHVGSVVCIDMYDKYCASGSRDNRLKVWDFHTGRCYRTFYHGATVRTVQIIGTYIVTGDDSGKVRLWTLENSTCVKVLEGHMAKVNSVRFDQWHIVSGSSDHTARLWITQGKYRWSIATYPHPSEVFSVQFVSLRVVTGCADGKMRLWNMLNGHCLRTIQGNSKYQAIRTLHATRDRLAINTQDGVYLFAFLPVKWDYKTAEVKAILPQSPKQPTPPAANVHLRQQKAKNTVPKPGRPRSLSLKLNRRHSSNKQTCEKQSFLSIPGSVRSRPQSSSSLPSSSRISAVLHQSNVLAKPQLKRVAWSDSRASISSLESETNEKTPIGRKPSDEYRTERLDSVEDGVFTVTMGPVMTRPSTSPPRMTTSGGKIGTVSNLLRTAGTGKTPAASQFSVPVGDQHNLLCTTPATFPLMPGTLNLRTHTAQQQRILAFKEKEREITQPVNSYPLQLTNSWVGPLSPSSPIAPPRSKRALSCGPRPVRSSSFPS